MPVVNVNNIDMYYSIQGEGEPLLLISGFGGDNSNWQYMLTELTKHFQVIIPDNRGSGRTTQTKPPYTIAQMAEDTIALLDQLALDRIAVAGSSMGGMIVQQLCLDYPERMLAAVIVGSAPKLPKAALMSIESTLALVQAEVETELVIRVVLPTIYGSSFLEKKENVEFVMDRVLTNLYPQTLEGGLGQLQALSDFNVEDRLQEITCPTLILVGDEDVLIPKKYSQLLADKIKQAQLQVIPQCGHMMYLEAPDAFSDAIIKFLK